MYLTILGEFRFHIQKNLAVERRPSYTGFGEQGPSFAAIGRALLQSGLTDLLAVFWHDFSGRQAASRDQKRRGNEQPGFSAMFILQFM
jgi:hypothetical protein